MELAAIATASHLDELAAYIASDLGLADADARVEREKSPSLGAVHVLAEAPSDEGRLRLLWIVAHATARFVVEALEADILTRIVRHRYAAIDPRARVRVVTRAERHLSLSCHGSGAERADGIALALAAQLRSEGVVILEGALRFRLGDYMAALEDAVGQAVDDDLLEREYVEFIRLLRCFVAAQPPRTDRVHLVVEGALVRLFDREGRPMPLDGRPALVLESLEAALNYEDILISALIAAAPTRIVIHPEAGAQSHHVAGVRRVFEARVEHCQGARCLLCRGA